MSLDPVTLEILITKAAATTEEMGLHLKRTGRTIYVKEAGDLGTALVSLDGKFFACSKKTGVGGFVDLDCGQTIKTVGELFLGDVIVTNHPYHSNGLSTHLPDFHLVKPYFFDGRIVCYGWAFIHSSDVGGNVPSSLSPRNSEIYQEGFAVPPLKLVNRGVVSHEIETLIRTNSRTGDANIGDIRAMLGCLSLGERRVAQIIERHGIETFEQSIGEIIDYTSKRAKTVFCTIPDGRYEFSDYIDDDFASTMPLRIRVAVTVNAGHVHLDFTGTDASVAAAYNVPSGGGRHTLLTMWLTNYLLTVDPTLPYNSGLLEPVTVTVPQGSLLNPPFPSAVGIRHIAVTRICDVLNGALAEALPDIVPSCGAGVNIPIVFAEPTDSNGDQNVIVVQPLVGGGGARKGVDGINGRAGGIINIGNNPVEAIESHAEIVIGRYGLRTGSGGPGRWRGGLSVELTFSARIPGTQVLGRGADRYRFVPWGLFSGNAGAAARTVLNFGRPNARDLGRIDVITLEEGDTITFLSPGGGGYGSPLERAVEQVRSDVVNDFLTVEAARRDYGVVIRPDGLVDTSATSRLRMERTSKEDSQESIFDFGHFRMAWEYALNDSLLSELASYFSNQSLGVRPRVRKKILGPLLQLLDQERQLEPDELVKAAQQVRANLELVQRELVETGTPQ